jgi:hypothetical protein
MTEKRLERLNYYNGQRLEASDLKLEQEYHIRVRRWLNRSLYSPGIARGLEVREEKGTRIVVISPGLALDDEGHEIILLEEAREVVPGRGRHRSGSGSDAEVEGLFLTIRYDERTVAEERGVCFAHASSDSRGQSRPASGGPARIDATPVFAWRAFLPHESSGEIALAQVELDKDCEKVHQINAGVRRYVGAASAAKVRQYALEGEREVAYIPGLPTEEQPRPRIYFHVRGRQPGAVTLYLRAAKFSPLHYTEMGSHDHATKEQSLPTGPPILDTDLTKYQHSHSPGNLAAASVSPPVTMVGNRFVTGLFPVDLRPGAPTPPREYAFAFVRTGAGGDMGTLLGSWVESPPPGGLQPVAGARGAIDATHGHTIGSSDTNPARTGLETIAYPHTHSVPPATVVAAGVTDPRTPPVVPTPPEYSSRTGPALTFVDSMEVWIGKDDEEAVDQTDSIREQLADANSNDWPAGMRLGNGKGDHPLVKKGTGPIRLDFLPDLYFTEGQYYIELRIPKRTDGTPNGGRVLYNLYVE